MIQQYDDKLIEAQREIDHLKEKMGTLIKEQTSGHGSGGIGAKGSGSNSGSSSVMGGGNMMVVGDSQR